WLCWLKTMVPSATVVGAPSALASPRLPTDENQLLHTPLQPLKIVAPVQVLPSFVRRTLPLAATLTRPLPLIRADSAPAPERVSEPPSPMVIDRAVGPPSILSPTLVPAAVLMSLPAAPSAASLRLCSVPARREIEPLKVFAPPNCKVPPPALTSPALPAITESIRAVPLAVLMVGVAPASVSVFPVSV